MSPYPDKLLRKFQGDERGAITILAALCMTVLVGMVGLGVDFGYVYYCQDRLQSSTDAAALAGAQQINVGTGGTAIAVATHYSSSGSGSLNQYQATATMASGYPVLACLRSTGVSCNGADNANAIRVSQTAVVPTFFARLFGLNSWNISATSLASARGGMSQPVDVEIILDTTASMNTADIRCISVSGATREQCALAGVRTLLSELAPCSATLSSCGAISGGNVNNPIDRVGLMVFPGLQSNQQQYDYDCSASAPNISKYSGNPAYQIVPFSSDYRSADNAPTLATSSNLVIAARGGTSGCQQGLSAVGGVGTFFADAINEAQDTLANDGRPTARKVIILLSDGAANATTQNMPGNEVSNQCHQAITAARNATNAGTWVYSISYGATTSTGDCPTDTPAISPCSTMQQIASDTTKYFSDTSGGDNTCTSTANSISQLDQIFAYIGVDASTARLLPLDTT